MSQEAQISLGPVTLTESQLQKIAQAPARLDRLEVLVAAVLLKQSGATGPDDMMEAFESLRSDLSEVLPEAEELVGRSLQSLFADMAERFVEIEGDDDAA